MLNQTIEVLEIVTPVFALAMIGFVWARAGLEFDIPFVTRLSMNVSGPCLIFATLARVEIDRTAFETLAAATVVLYAITILSVGAMIWIGRLSIRTYVAPLTFGNTGNVGLPVCFFAFGELGLAYAMIVFAVMAVMSFTLGVWLVSGRSSPTEALRQPLFWGSFLGVAIAYAGPEAQAATPEVVVETLSLVGQIIIPIMLITLGVSVAQLDAKGLARSATLAIAKTGIAVAAALIAAEAFGLEGPARGVLILQAIMPVAVTSYLLSERYKAGPKDVASLVVVSTLLCVLILPVTLKAVL